ncbi:MAG: hypothetical protein AAFV19_09535 [Pseudomonadota bacterium]
MSFNPNAAKHLRPYAEPVLFGILGAFGLYKGVDLLWRGAWFGLVPTILGAIAALVAVAAAQKLLVAKRSGRDGPGIVLIDEGRISFFGPFGGAVMTLDDLTSVEITIASGPGGTASPYWVLGDLTGAVVHIPSTAEHAEELVDALGTLPGFDRMAVVRAMAAQTPAHYEIWQRPGWRGRPRSHNAALH